MNMYVMSTMHSSLFFFFSWSGQLIVTRACCVWCAAGRRT
jgi:hypothetical protein